MDSAGSLVRPEAGLMMPPLGKEGLTEPVPTGTCMRGEAGLMMPPLGTEGLTEPVPTGTWMRGEGVVCSCREGGIPGAIRDPPLPSRCLLVRVGGDGDGSTGQVGSGQAPGGIIGGSSHNGHSTTSASD